MHIDYNFISESESAEVKFKQDLISYAGKLLELAGAYTLVIGVGDDDKPFVFKCDSRLIDTQSVYFQPNF